VSPSFREKSLSCILMGDIVWSSCQSLESPTDLRLSAERGDFEPDARCSGSITDKSISDRTSPSEEYGDASGEVICSLFVVFEEPRGFQVGHDELLVFSWGFSL